MWEILELASNKKPAEAGNRCGCFEDTWRLKSGGDRSPPVLLLNRFVSCEDSDLRLAGSEPYLAKVLPRNQYRHNGSYTDNDQGDK